MTDLAVGLRRLLVSTLVVVTTCGAAQAIQPGQWLHTAEADFEPGQRDGTIVTNLGDVKLSAATQIVAEMPEQASIVYDMLAGDDGAIYLAAGTEAKLLVRRGEKIEEVAALPGEQIFALDQLGASVLVGISAEGKSRLAVLHEGKLVDIVTLPEVRYVWDLLVAGNDVLVATGTEGQVIRIADVGGYVQAVREGKPAEAPKFAVVLDATPGNVLCLGTDGQKRIYAGTDGDGLVYRLTPKAEGEGYDAFVLYDAPEPEIGTLLVKEDGTVYAGTADAEQAKPGRLEQAAVEEGGRPGGEAAPAAPPKEEPAPPKPGDLPQVPPRAPPIGEPGDVAPGQTPPTDNEPQEQAEPAKPETQPQTRAADRPDVVAMAEADAKPADDTPSQAQPTTPSPEQFDRLREVIRQRLDQARKTGAMQAGRPTRPQPRRAAAGPGRTAAPPPPGGGAPKEGNAIYRIDPNGFVTEVFRESVMILKLVDVDGKLLVATGNEGQLYRVDPVADETTILADLEPQQIPAILRGPDGSTLLGTANPATLVSLDEGFADKGEYTSVVLDAGQISLWGKLKLTGELPQDTTVTVQTRAGNVQNVDDAAWSPWSDAGKFAFDPHLPAGIELEPRELTIASPPARFLQYRLVLATDGATSPTVGRIQLAYVTPNMRPGVTAITAQYPDAPPAGGGSGPAGRPGPAQAAGANEPATAMNITWEAADPNGDRLLYTLEYQPAGSKTWLPLAKDLDATSHEWQTRQVPDGRYIVRVTASDSPDNPADMATTSNRVSDPVLIDNTAPAFFNVKTRREGAKLTIEGEARDGLSAMRSIQYNLDGAERYEPVLPTDLIYDSTRETFVVTISRLSPGPHVVTLRATDTRGNNAHQAVLID